LELGIDLVHANAQVSYHGWADKADVLEIEVSIAKLSSTSLTAACTAKKQDGSLVATGELTSICVDRETMKSMKVPTPMRDAIEG
jgi:acyl-CoA thioesterase FadM